jgi:hypothetical protein
MGELAGLLVGQKLSLIAHQLPKTDPIAGLVEGTGQRGAVLVHVIGEFWV